MMFLPNNDADEAKGRELAEAAVAAEGFEVLGWRAVPVVPEVVGRFAKATEPRIAQLVVKDGSGRSGADLERALYLMRKAMERSALEAFGEERATEFYVCSLSGEVWLQLLPPCACMPNHIAVSTGAHWRFCVLRLIVDAVRVHAAGGLEGSCAGVCYKDTVPLCRGHSAGVSGMEASQGSCHGGFTGS